MMTPMDFCHVKEMEVERKIIHKNVSQKGHVHCDQIGSFFKFLAINFILRVAQTLVTVNFIFQKHFLIKNCSGFICRQLWGKMGYFLI